MDQRDKIESSEIDTQKLTEEQRKSNWEKYILNPFTTINSEWTTDLNEEYKQYFP